MTYLFPQAFVVRIMWCMVDCLSTTYTKMGDVAQWVEHQHSYPKTLGSIPLRGRVRDSFSQFYPSESALVQRLVCAWPPFVCMAHTQICVHVKDHLSIYRKRIGLRQCYGHTKILHTQGQELVKTVTGGFSLGRKLKFSMGKFPQNKKPKTHFTTSLQLSPLTSRS